MFWSNKLSSRWTLSVLLNWSADRIWSAISADQLESSGGFFGLPRLWAPCRSGRDGALLRESLDSNSAEPAHMAAWHTNHWLRFQSTWKKYAVCGTRIVKECKGCSKKLKILPWLILIVFDFARKSEKRQSSPGLRVLRFCTHPGTFMNLSRYPLASFGSQCDF